MPTLRCRERRFLCSRRIKKKKRRGFKVSPFLSLIFIWLISGLPILANRITQVNSKTYVLFELIYPFVAWLHEWDIMCRNVNGNVLADDSGLLGRSPFCSESCKMSKENTVALQKKTKEFDIPFNRQQLADYLNLERTNMSKELSKMQAEGLIEFRKNHFKLNSKIDDTF